MTRLLVAAYLVEAGLLLLVAPWTTFWERNLFGNLMPSVGDWMASRFVRGGVSGVGIVTMAAGLRDLAGAIIARSSAANEAVDQRPPP